MARHVGTVVHRWLQRIADDGSRGWDAKRLTLLQSNLVRELRRLGVQHSRVKEGTALVIAALENTLADERGRWLLSAHPEARSEYRLRTRGSEGMRSYVMDRVFRDAEGVRWIVDYKTSRHEGTDIEAFLDRERERYAPQLQAYMAAMQGTHAGLYFPLLKGWRQFI
jgi:ATP-dependent helicase/nuclease subunit A